MKLFKALRNATWTLGILALALLLTTLAAISLVRAKDVGNRIGEFQGKIVGTAIGSWNGVIEGRKEGTAAGEAAGLSAEDTTAEIKGYIQQAKKLQVLCAGVTLHDTNGVGKDYKALYAIAGTAVFAVDLNDISVLYADDGVRATVYIPQPKHELYLDESNTKKIAEYQKFSWSVGAKDGFENYINTMNEMPEKSKEKIPNYTTLQEIANVSAQEQVKQLAEAASGNRLEVTVKIKEGMSE